MARLHGTWKRAAAVATLAALIAGGIAGIAAEVLTSRSEMTSRLRHDAAARASLGAAMMSAALRGSPPRRADAAGRTGGRPAAGPVAGAAVERLAVDVARAGGAGPGTSVFLVDGAGDVLAAAPGGGTTTAPRLDPALRAALARGATQGRFEPGGARFFSAAKLSAAPWRIVYTTPAGAVDGSLGGGWVVSLALLAAIAGAAAACLLLLIRALKGWRGLDRANAALRRRNQRIEHATEAKTRFVANMSHELRTPLNAVIGFTELMHEGRTGPVSKRQREYLGIVRASAAHLLTLINEVLDLSRIEAGHIRLDPEAVEPAVVATECVSAMRWLAHDSRVRLQYAPVAVGAISLDPARLRQVILNYLSNAIKFTGAGGRVDLRLAHDGERLSVEVTDTGVGLSTEDQGRVFDEFVQVAGRARGGSGLGLAVTRQIVEAQGGEVGVTSQLGFGSTFYARLPSMPAEASPVAQAPEPEPEPESLAADRADGRLGLADALLAPLFNARPHRGHPADAWPVSLTSYLRPAPTADAPRAPSGASR
jgi:signal transduction histidine kinase